MSILSISVLLCACSSSTTIEQGSSVSSNQSELLSKENGKAPIVVPKPNLAQPPTSVALADKPSTTKRKSRRRDPIYALDNVSRKVAVTGKVSCPPVELVSYKGENIPYNKPARVYVGFAEHLRRFDSIVEETAIEVYGRAPSKIVTYGSYYCRRIRSWPYLISEHGLGNALDVAGFEFKKMSGTGAESLPRSLRRGFKVSMSRHWNASSKEKVHERFLRLLATRVIESEGLFRVILGPADPKHHDHFHFDMAPFRIVNVF